MNLGGKFGSGSYMNPMKVYNFYVDFTGLVSKMRKCLYKNPLAYEIDNEIEYVFEHYQSDEEIEEAISNGKDIEIKDDTKKMQEEFDNNYKVAKKIVGEDVNGTSEDLYDFMFHVKDVTLPKYTMKTVKRNQMDTVKYYPIKTSYGGEVNLTMESTYRNIGKLSILMGFFETIDSYDLWDKVYDTDTEGDNINLEHPMGNAVDIVVVGDDGNDTQVFKLLNTIVTSIDFGTFDYGTNAINEIRMVMSYNSWYSIDGETRESIKRGTNFFDNWGVNTLNILRGGADAGVNFVGKGTNWLMKYSNDFWKKE